MAWWKRSNSVSKAVPSIRVPARRPLAMALEPRVMFDGAVAATAAQLPHGPDPVVAAEPHALAAERAEFRLAPAGVRADMVSMRALAEHDIAPLATSSAGRDVLFIDARVKDADSLLAHVAAGTEVVYLQQGMDGLQQMANYLDAHLGARSVQIITHGNDGDLWLGSTYLSADNIGQHADALARIGADIQAGGDILIYSCDTAAGAKGLSFVASLADLTHRDVAASSNRIGAGYDWNLEVTTGTIDSRQVLSGADEAGYTHDLAIITVTNNADAGVGSLRAAIASASASGDTITFNAGMTINLSTHASGDSLLLIDKNLTIEGDIDGNGTADVTLDGQYKGRVLEITSGKAVTLDGLVIQHGLVSGDGGNGGAGAAAALGGGIFNAGNLTLNNVAVTANAASAGGGGGGVTSAYRGGGGGGGGGIGGGIGGAGGSTGSGTGNYAGVAGSANTGGRGGGYDTINMGGRGGSSTGGAGGIGTYSYTNGGNGGTASNGSISIGGGGGGAGWDAQGGIGGNAVGGIYNAGTGVLTIIGTSVISNNLGAGGGGGGGSANGSSTTFDGGDGGVGIGGILNNGGTVNITAANFAAMTGNAGGSGIGGSATGGSNGITPGSADMLSTLGGGTTDTAYSPLAITSATYNAATGVLAVTGTNMTVGDTIDSSKLTLTGEGGATYTLTSSSVTASSATGFSITLNVTDQAALNQIINKNGTSSTGGTSFNLAAAANWDATAAAGADASNIVTASNVAVPSITSATYDASTGALIVTGTGFAHLSGATNDIVANKFTLTGEGGATYTLTDTANVEVTSGTSFTLTLSATDKAGINLIENKNGTSSTGGTTYNLAAAEDWAAGADAAVVVADTTGNGVTTSNVAVPSITSSTYNASTGTLVVTGTGFTHLSGATNDIVANKFTFTGEGGTTYTLTDTANVEITSGTSFTLTLSATDKAGINLIENKNGTSSTSGTIYNVAAAEDWAAGAATAVVVADTTGNGITTSNVALPSITNATYDASTGTLVVTGSGFLSASGAANDIIANKFSLRGEGGTFYALTDTANVEVTSGTSFTLTLSATDKAGVNLIVNKNGGLSTDISSYRFTAADDWAAGADPSLNVADSLNPFTASNVAVPAITSATYDASTGVMVVTGSGFLSRQGATNDIVANKFTLTGEGGATYTLTDTANVEIISGTSFTLTLSATDKAGINLIENKNGTSSTGATTYNLAAAEDWAAGADAAVVVADTTGNGVTVSNVAVPTITSATYDASTGVVVVTGSGFTHLSGATNDIVANKFTFTGEGGATYTLTDTANVEITSGTSFTLTLSATDKAGINLIENKNGTSSTGGTTYNLAAAEDWAAGADTAVVVADTTGNGITTSNVAVPSITSATYDASTGVLVVTGTGFTHLSGATNDIVANKFTLTGEGGATYTLTDTANVEITSATSFTLTLSATDKAGINLIENKNGTSSTSGTTYNVAAAEDWAAGADTAVTVADTTGNGVTASNVAVPTITSATFDAASGMLVVTGTGFHSAAGATNDIIANKFTLTGDGGATYTLTDTSNVEITSGTSFTLALSATDKAAILPLLNKNGTVSVGATTYNLAAAEDWAAGADAAVVVADLTGNGITASNVDSTPPAVASVVLPFNSTYVAGQNLDFTVSFGEKVFVNTGGGTPYIDITLDSGGTAHAIYLLGSGSKFLTFRYTVASGDADATGIALAGAISANGATLKDPTGNNATLTLNGVGSTAGLKVDAVAPTVSSVSAPADASYATGQNLDFTVNFSETVYVNTGGGTPRIALTLDTGGTVYATYVSGSASSALTFRYTVATGNMDTDGITVGSVVAANGGTVRDAGGNYATLTLNNVGSTAGVLVDTLAPSVNTINRVTSATTSATSVDYTVTFAESVTGVDASDFALTATGTASGAIASVTQLNGSTYTVTVNTLSGDGTLRLDLNGSGTGIADLPGNAITAGYTSGQTYSLDHTAPAVASVGVPANATYAAGDNLDFTVNLNEAVTVDTGGGTPRIAITLDTGGTVYADYLSGSGTSALTFRYTVATGVADANGIAVGALASNGGTLKDAAGNNATLTLNSVGSTAAVLVDAAAPAVSSVDVPADGTYGAGNNLDFTINFNEAVTVNTGGGTPRVAITLDTGGTVYADYVSGSGTSALTFRYTIGAGTLDTNGITVGTLSANGGTLKDAANNDASLTLNSVGSTSAVLVDAVAPSVATIDRVTGATTSATSVDYTVTFAESVTGVDASDFTLTATGTAAGTISAVTQVNGSTYTVTVNTLSGDGTLRLDLNSSGTGIADTAGNAIAAGYTSGQIYSLDHTAPAVNSVSVPANATYVAGDNLDFTVNLNEAVTVDTAGGTPRIAITLDTGGTVYADYLSGSGTSALTFRYTVATGVADANGIAVGALASNGGTLKDAAGNNATLTLNSVGSTAAVLVDASAPAASIVVADTAVAAGETSQVTITFSEAVSGFSNADLSVANGTLSAVSSSDGGVTWTATFTPTSNVTDASNVITLDNTGVADLAGNTGTGSTASNNYAIDTQRPTASIVMADTSLAAGETSQVTITFSEAVSGLTAADLSVANGAVSGLASSDGGVTWTATFTPTSNVTDASNLITLDNSGVADSAGNTGTGSTTSNNYAIDTQRPTASIVVVDTAVAAGETSQVTITFSEAVSGFSNADLSVANGTLSAVSSSDGGVTWTATFTPTSNVTDASNVITLDNSGVADLAGNTGTGSTDSNNYAIDTQRPTASIVVADTAVAAGETSQVTITFSEAVSGLTVDDLSVANGAINGLASDDGGVTWTATFTPTSNVTDASNLITLDNTGVADLAGNTGTGSTDSNNYAIDTRMPQVLAITRNDASINSGQQGLSYTITFSEDVSGVDIGDLQLVFGGSVRATIDSLVQVDGHTYVVKLSNVGGSGSLRLDLIAQASGIVDGASNALAAGVQGEIYTVGGVAPVILASEAPLPGATASASIFTPPADLMGLPQLSERDLPTLFFADAAPLQSQGRPLSPGTFGAAGVVTFDAERTEAFADHVRDRFALPQSAFIDAGRPFVIALPASSLGRGSVLQATLADGRPLPAWLRFDPVAGTLQGTAPAGFRERLTLQLLLVDADGHVQSLTLELDPSAPADVHAKPSKEAPSAHKPTASGKPALQEQFGSQRHAGGVDHAALLHQLAIAQRHHVTPVAP